MGRRGNGEEREWGKEGMGRRGNGEEREWGGGSDHIHSHTPNSVTLLSLVTPPPPPPGLCTASKDLTSLYITDTERGTLVHTVPKAFG